MQEFCKNILLFNNFQYKIIQDTNYSFQYAQAYVYTNTFDLLTNLLVKIKI